MAKAAVGKFPDQRSLEAFLDQILPVLEFCDLSAGMRQNHFIEFFVGFRIADQLREGLYTGAGREHVDALSR